MNVLDRVVFAALDSRQREFAVSNGAAHRFHADVEPFAGCADESESAMADLVNLIPAEGSVLLLQPRLPALPASVSVLFSLEGVQMVAERLPPPVDDAGVEELGEAQAGEMLELASLAKPGPFKIRTWALGGFVGIRQQGRLVAMAGERMKPPGHTEVSGVCTHPDFCGRGFGSRLSNIVIQRIAARGETPFLHAIATNANAIRLYERLGFTRRCTVQGVVLKRN